MTNMFRGFSLVVITTLLVSCSASSVVGDETPESFSDPEDRNVHPSLGIACNSVERLFDEAPALLGYKWIQGENESITRERLDGFLAPLASFTAALGIVGEESEGDSLIQSLEDSHDAGWNVYYWALGLPARDRAGDIGGMDLSFFSVGLESFAQSLKQSHAACVSRGYLQDNLRVSSLERAESLFDYGFWWYDVEEDDFGEKAHIWMGATTTSVAGAEAMMTILITCEPGPRLVLSAMALPFNDQVSVDLAAGGIQEIEVGLDGQRETWATLVTAPNASTGLVPFADAEKLRSFSVEERNKLLFESFQYLSGFETVSVRQEHERAQYSGKISMAGSDRILAELEDLGCSGN